MDPPLSTGYYSLLQYCPDHSRLEAANVGVVLFCPGQRYLHARLTAANRRIRHCFGEQAGNSRQLRAVKRMFEHRLEAEAPDIRNLAAWRRFGSLLANELTLTEPRPVRVEDPDTELAQLFVKLFEDSLTVRAAPWVGDRPGAAPLAWHSRAGGQAGAGRAGELDDLAAHIAATAH